MKCSLVSYTDTDSSFRLFGLDGRLNQALAACLAGQDYGPGLQEIIVGVLCLAPERAAFHRPKRPRYVRGPRTFKGLTSARYTVENLLTYDIVLPYEAVCAAGPPQALRILTTELLGSLPLIVRGRKSTRSFGRRSLWQP